jgi:hypothetical protein
MSYLLKTAAMTLLSKTLQTFLYKYLSDVDVEGVALPSYDGSGWGVRLSNVKLREGVQLMKHMPGTVIKQRKRRRRRTQRKTTKTTKKKKPRQEVDENTTIASTSTSGEERIKARSPDDLPLEAAADSNSYSTNKAEENPNADSKGDGGMDESIHLRDLRQGLASQTPSVDDDGDGSRPSTPVQDSKSIFSCFHSSTRHLNTSQHPLPKIPDISLDGGEQQRPNGTKSITTLPSNDSELTLAQESVHNSKPRPHHLKLEQKDGSTHPLEEEDDEDEDDDDEFEDYEQSFKLCLGENGRIGTLDIR